MAHLALPSVSPRLVVPGPTHTSPEEALTRPFSLPVLYSRCALPQSTPAGTPVSRPDLMATGSSMIQCPPGPSLGAPSLGLLLDATPSKLPGWPCPLG